MNKQKSLVEDTFLQMRNLEEVINENAKGILASTMKEEIRSLVKESLNEQEDEDEIEVDAEFDDTDVSDDDVDNLDVDMGDELDLDADDETIDLTDASTEDVLKVFRAMGPEDGVIVKKEEGMIHLSDENNDVEYVIQLSESEQDDEEFYLDKELEEDDEDDEDKTKTIYEVELDDTDEDSYESHLSGKFNSEMKERFNRRDFDDDEEEENDEIFDPEMIERFNMEIDPEDEDDEDLFGNDDDDEFVVESKSKFKSKGIGMGNSSKFKYDKKPNQGDGFKTKMKQGTRGVGMGKPKFEYKEGENMEKGKNTPVKKIETKESARTLGNGSRNSPNRKSLPKLRVRTHESVSNSELQILREKNEEYRNALNVFRDKLNEVAVFNSNLAYATRLFTEHSTTKQEKINILKRFDTVETLKESKNLYKVVKDELSNVGKESHFVNETFERTVQKTPTSGSAVNLIESKTYENPQFLRMKDLMSKIK